MSLTRKLNVRHKYTLKIQVTDRTGLTAETSIEASVEDVNDHPPVFAKTSYEFRISEGALVIGINLVGCSLFLQQFQT